VKAGECEQDVAREKNMKWLPSVLSIATLLLAAGAHAQSPAPANRGPPVEMKASGTPGKAVARQTLRVTATVYAVDVATRIVTLQHDMGGVETLKVGPGVKSLDTFAVGDTVVVDYEQGLALELQPAGSEFVPPTTLAPGAPADKDPAVVASGGQSVQSTVTITAIDLARRLVTIQTPGGNVFRVKAGPKIQIDKLKVGDRLLGTYVEAVAIKLEKVKTP
jgi:Cu/Ag efflux protein CusF